MRKRRRGNRARPSNGTERSPGESRSEERGRKQPDSGCAWAHGVGANAMGQKAMALEVARWQGEFCPLSRSAAGYAAERGCRNARLNTGEQCGLPNESFKM